MNMASLGDNCLKFESPLVVGTKFLEDECFSEEGVTLTVAASPGIAEPMAKELCYALIAERPRGIPWWVGNHVELRCVSLVFEFGSTVSNVQLQYYEEDDESSEPPVRVIEINTRSQSFARAADDLDGVVLGGVTIAAEFVPGNPKYGTLVLNGRIDSLAIGSVQQFCIDDVCFSRS
jgi:hypothetical protein